MIDDNAPQNSDVKSEWEIHDSLSSAL